MPAGMTFPEHLVRTVSACSVMLVVIGVRWLESLDARRLRTDDWLRLEIGTALGSARTRVIPVLVQGASMPAPGELPDDLRALSTIAALELSDSRWEYDMKRLVSELDRLVPPVSEAAAVPVPPAPPSSRPPDERTDASPASSMAWIAGIVLMSGISIGLVPPIAAASPPLPPELHIATLAGMVLSAGGLTVACTNHLLRRIPQIRVVALTLLVVGTMLLSIGAGATLHTPPGPPPDGRGGPPPNDGHGPPPDGRGAPPPRLDGPSRAVSSSSAGGDREYSSTR